MHVYFNFLKTCIQQGCAHAGRARPALLLAAQYKTKQVQVPPGRNFY